MYLFCLRRVSKLSNRPFLKKLIHNKVIIILYSSTLEPNGWRQFYCSNQGVSEGGLLVVFLWFKVGRA